MPQETRETRAISDLKKVYGLEETKPSRAAGSIFPVGVYGATGYTGQVLMSLLAKHPNVKIVFATSESAKETVEGLELVRSVANAGGASLQR